MQYLRVGRVRACDPMRSQLKDIADLRDRRCDQIRFQGAFLKPVSAVTQNDLVDLIEGEARDLDRSVGQDQLLELDFERLQAPAAGFAQTVDGEAQHTLLVVAQMLDANARHAFEAKAPRRFDPRRTIEDETVPSNQDGRAEAERGNRVGDLSHMRRLKLADFARRHLQHVERDMHQLETR